MVVLFILLFILICLFYYRTTIECFTESFTDSYYETISKSWNDINLIPKLNGKHNDYSITDDKILNNVSMKKLI